VPSLQQLLRRARGGRRYAWLAGLVGGALALAGFTVGALALPHVVAFDSNLFRGVSVAVFGGAVVLGGLLLSALSM